MLAVPRSPRELVLPRRPVHDGPMKRLRSGRVHRWCSCLVISLLGFKTPMVCYFTLISPHSFSVGLPFRRHESTASPLPPATRAKTNCKERKKKTGDREAEKYKRKRTPRSPTPAIYHALYWVLKNLSRDKLLMNSGKYIEAHI